MTMGEPKCRHCGSTLHTGVPCATCEKARENYDSQSKIIAGFDFHHQIQKEEKVKTECSLSAMELARGIKIRESVTNVYCDIFGLVNIIGEERIKRLEKTGFDDAFEAGIDFVMGIILALPSKKENPNE